MIFYGASGHASVVIEAWEASGGSVTAIFDDNESIKSLKNHPVIGKYEARKASGHNLVLSIGANQVRQRLALRVQGPFGTVVHPFSCVSKSVNLGEGSVVMGGVVVNANSRVGKHVILNTSSSVDHDCIIEDFAHISPGSVLCGGVNIGEGTHIGAGATVIQNVKIGKWAIVAAGSVVIKDVPDHAMVMGVPAKIVKFNK